MPDSLKRFGHTLSASPFVRNLARLAGATTLGGLLAFAASPVITRLYSPSEFAVLGVFATTLSLVMGVASLRYDLAIPYPNEEREAASVLHLALLTIIGTTLLCAVLIFVGLPAHVPGLKTTLSGRSIWWLPIGMWASATYAALSIWMIRRRDFATIGTTKITQGALQAGSQIVLGLARFGSSGLIVGQIVGTSAGLMRLWKRIRQDSPFLFQSLSPSQLKKTAVAYKRFPLYSTPAVLLDSATGAMPLFFIAAQFGPVPTGLYTLVQRVITMPFALLTVNLGQLVFGDLAELRRSGAGSLTLTFRRRVVQVAALGFALLVPLLLIVPLLLPRIFGERWAAAGTYFVVLAPMIYASFVSSPFGFVIDVVRRQDLHLLRDSVRAFLTGAALVAAAELKTELLPTLAIISAAGTVSGLFHLFVSWRAIVSHDITVAKAAAVDLDPTPFFEPS